MDAWTLAFNKAAQVKMCDHCGEPIEAGTIHQPFPYKNGISWAILGWDRFCAVFNKTR